MKVDLIIATYNRAQVLKETLENVSQFLEDVSRVIVVNNNSKDETRDVLSQFEGDKIKVIHLPENLGAAGGKNVGMRASEADVLIVIDDDAVFFTEDPLGEVRRIFSSRVDIGLIQFKIVNFQTRKILGYEFPGRNPARNGDSSFDAGYYIGAGHALRRQALEEVGYYPDDFFYAHEEIDLSYRLVNSGYVIRYEPSIGVYHKKAPGGRLPPPRVLRNMFFNRLLMTRKYLPQPYALVNSVLWFFKTAKDSRSLSLPLSVLKEFRRVHRDTTRHKLTPAAIDYLRRTGGRLYR